ncbi:MAG TPA: hypothetical protein VFB35_08170 [Gaiellaceae bacterium]|nr:hypothetical protein [Gaiellaceae bacterium]
MTAADSDMDAARLTRALDRLAEACDVNASRNAAIEARRAAIRAQLERELGSELARKLLTGLASAA